MNETIDIFGKSYKINIFDTKSTILNRIAYKEKTLPNFIKVNQIDMIDNVYDIELLNRDMADTSFIDLKNNVSSLSKKYDVSKKDILYEYIRINYGDRASQDTMGQNEVDTFVMVYRDANKNELGSRYVIFKGLENFLSDYRKKRMRLKQDIDKEIQLKEKFSNYKPVPYTQFVQDSLVKEYQLETDVEPLDLFNQLNLTPPMVFCQLQYEDQSYFKIMEDGNSFINEQWTNTLKNNQMEIKLKYDDETDEYYTISITYKEKKTRTNYSLSMIIEYSKNTKSEDIENMLFNNFENTELKIISTKDLGIRGVFGFKEIGLAKDVFLDLLTNNRFVSYYFYTDESRNLSMRKTSIYIYYSPMSAKQNVMTAYLSEKETSRKDPLFEKGQLNLYIPYLNVRISRAKNMKQVIRFQKALSVIIAFYIDQYKSVVDKYSKLIPNFKTNNPDPVLKKTKQERNLKILQETNPQLFIQGYPTKCEKKKQPIPIDKQDLPKNASAKKYMEYPKNSGQFYYCPYDEHPYPGLLKNKLDNKEQYPYLPCCYPENQLREKKLYNLYYSGKDDISKKTDKNINVNYVKFKAIGYDRRGFLPKNVYYCLGDKFYRTGSPIDKNSFLHSILIAFDATGYAKQSDPEKYIQDVRRNIANSPNANYKQSLYNYDRKDFIQLLLDFDKPLDSKYTTELFENYFHCRIFVFERDEKNPNGTIEIPYYSQGYLYKTIEEDTPVLFIYKHMGIRSDYLKYPHYEVIYKELSPRKKQTVFTKNQNTLVIDRFQKYFNHVYQLYIFNEGKYEPTTFPTLFSNTPYSITSQCIDVYGKCRGIVLNTRFAFFFSPIYPIPDIPILQQEEFNVTNTKKETRDLLNEMGLSIVSQNINSSQKANGYNVTPFANTFYLYIPFIEDTPDTDIEKVKGDGYFTNDTNNALVVSKTNKKIANFLMQYAVYSYSKYIADKDVDTITTSNSDNISDTILKMNKTYRRFIDEFVEKNIVVVENYQYNLKTIPHRLSLNTNFFQDNKLIVTDKETKEKLKYYLHYLINKNVKFVKEYKEQEYLKDYYVYNNDFIQRMNQKVFIGLSSFQNWIASKKDLIDKNAIDYFLPEIKEPYFMHNWHIDKDKPVMIQNVINGEKARALNILYNYYKDGINTGYYTDPIKESVSYSVIYYSVGTLQIRQIGEQPIGTLVQYGPDNFGAVIYIE